jgi:hypothetical protein
MPRPAQPASSGLLKSTPGCCSDNDRRSHPGWLRAAPDQSKLHSMSRRPPPLLWLRYAVGGKLPDEYDEWVFHDLTAPDWRIRIAGRIFLFAVLPIVGALLLPGPLSIRIFSALFVIIGPLYVGLAYGDELRDRRLRQHGLLPPDGPDPD